MLGGLGVLRGQDDAGDLVKMERDKESSESAEIISTPEARVKKLEEELKEREIEELNALRRVRKIIEAKDTKLSESAKRISTLESKVKKFESELREKDEKLYQIKKEKNKHELLEQKTYPLLLDSINGKLKLATSEEKAVKDLLNQLVKRSSQISEGEYKTRRRIHMEKLEIISQNLAELKRLKKEISPVRQG